MTDVVFFTLFRTDNPYSSISLSMAKTLDSRGIRVFYVQHPYSWKDVIKGLKQGDPFLRRRLARVITGRPGYERLAAIPHHFIAVQPPVTLPINWLPPGRIYDILQHWNNRVVLNTIKKVLRRYAVRDFVFINCYDPFFAGWLPAEMGAKCCFYHCIDDITQNVYTKRHGTELERKAAANADCTLVTSTNLHRLMAPYARRTELFFNAADVELFEQVWRREYPRPELLEGRSGAVIGFIGNLDELRIDYPLIKAVAEAYPEATLLLVGPENSPELRALGIHRLPNVVLAGSKPIDALPPLLQYMDCVLIPFLCNTLTRSIYPLKINEYLAAGKPVVSTAFSEDIRTFSHHIYLADDREAFIARVGEALAENNPLRREARVAVARSNNWEARIDQLFRLVADIEKT